MIIYPFSKNYWFNNGFPKNRLPKHHLCFNSHCNNLVHAHTENNECCYDLRVVGRIYTTHSLISIHQCWACLYIRLCAILNFHIKLVVVMDLYESG